MALKKLRNSLIKLIKEIPTAFSTNELAFYCLTNSFELHLRDKLAYRLQNQYPKSIILREWKKVDISIHKNNKVNSLIEIKYSFASSIVRRRDKMQIRILKSLKNQYNNDKRMSKNWYGLIFISCPKSKIPDKYADRVKNINAVNKYVDAYSSPRAWRQNIKQIIALHFPEKKFITKSGSIQPGLSFETNVDFLWFLITRKNR